MKIFRYEQSLHGLFDSPDPTIFLAGPTVRGHQPHLTSWRFEAIEEFKKHQNDEWVCTRFDGNLIVPEFTDPKESDKDKMWIPKWEFYGLCCCDIIMFWIPRTRELIGLTTNHEMGYWMGQCRDKVIYGRPDDSYRNGYLDLMWEMDAEQNEKLWKPIYNDLPTLVGKSIEFARLNEIGKRFRVVSKIPIGSPYGD